MATECFDDLTRTVAAARLRRSDFAFADPRAEQDLFRRLVPHEIVHRRSAGRLLVVQGTADTVVLPEFTRQMVAMARERGSSVEYVEVPGASHGGVLDRARVRVAATVGSLLD